PEPEIEQDLRADAVLAEVGLETESLVRLDRVGPAILQLVRLELVQQTDAPPFLVEVDDHAASVSGDHAHRFVQLPPAVTAQRVEDVAGETLRVHAGHDVLAVADLAVDQRDVLVIVDIVAIAHDLPLTVLRRQACL